MLRNLMSCIPSKRSRQTSVGCMAPTLSSKVASSPHDCLKNEFGYEFKDGILVDTKTGRRFTFTNQDEYDQLGQVVNEYVYKLLEGEGLRLMVLKESNPGHRTSETNSLPYSRKHVKASRTQTGPDADDRPRGFYFASNDIGTNSDGILVLIHGTGVVRAGQWSRRLIINESVESGSQLPYIQEAKKRNWSVVVMNTNQRNDSYRWFANGELFGGYDPEDHGLRVWKAVMERSPAKHVAIVAHSYGGHVTSYLLRKLGLAFKEKVFAIALTDSFCRVQSSDQDYFRKVAKNWVTSQLPLGDSVGYAHDCERVSAGTSVHEETSWKSMESVFAFLDKRWQEATIISARKHKGKTIETVV